MGWIQIHAIRRGRANATTAEILAEDVSAAYKEVASSFGKDKAVLDLSEELVAMLAREETPDDPEEAQRIFNNYRHMATTLRMAAGRF
jgi:hypothetical protein